MNNFSMLALPVLLVVLCPSLVASAAELAPAVPVSPATATTPEARQLAKKLVQLYPATRFTTVKPAPVDNLFEVTMGRTLAYVEPSGRHFFFGHIYDMQANRDLTADLTKDLNRIDTASLPVADAIVVTKGEGRRVLNVFSDPACHYCKQMEKVLDGMTDVRIQTWLIPLQPGGENLSRAIWCAANPAKAWRDWMLAGTQPPRPAANCSTAAITRNLSLAERLQTVGTPTVISGSGRVHSGAMGREELATWLALDGAANTSGAVSILKKE